MKGLPTPEAYDNLFQIDSEEQAGLEALLHSLRAGCLDALQEYGLASVEKTPGDDITILDKIATDRLANASERLGATLYSEEQIIRREGDLTLVADPGDGSSEIARLGFGNAPFYSTAMLINNGKIIAAAGINSNNGVLYGITDKELYRVLERDRRTLHVNPEQTNRFFAAYARKQKRSLNLTHICDALAAREIDYFANNGGAAYIFALTEALPRGYTAVGELLPKELWEHTPAFMATRAGAIVATLEREPLPLDIHQKSTSVIAVSPEMAEAYLEAVRLPR